MFLERQSAWGKRSDRNDGAWHSLLAHSIDVAAVFETIAFLPSYRARLSSALGRPVSDGDIGRLSYLALIHDIGKASPGFRFKLEDAKNVGHIRELLWLLLKGKGLLADKVVDTVFSRLYNATQAAGDEIDNLILATFAHHGSQVHQENIGDHKIAWNSRDGYDALEVISEIAGVGHSVFPLAFTDMSGEIDPKLTHLFAGMLQLADWIGSDRRVFEYWNGERDEERLEWARNTAAVVLKRFGIDGRDYRLARNIRHPSIEKTLGVPSLRAAQRETMLADGNLVILEGETGSGKTEAALARFFHLYDQGIVDSLYFALPTRVAATEIYHRICRVIDRGFPEGKRPSVLLAVPGQVRVDGLKGIPQPNFDFSWEDGRKHPEFWAAEHSKRFLTAAIAVGTIDQILLGSLRIKHAHMRHAASIRSLVVIDEVHASDTYMSEVMDTWLDNHLSGGGHALLLSATLGSARRNRLLNVNEKYVKGPSYEHSVSTPYPLLSSSSRSIHIPTDGRTKKVSFETVHAMDDFKTVARIAINAAEAGAKVLVIRNTVAAAMHVMQEVVKHKSGENLIWKVRGKAALHHSRFASGDRALLDDEVQNAIGRAAPAGGVIVIGTQTLEQSLDIDADLLITDLCPMDVLLQRLGRLHRNLDKVRVDGFELARAIVLAPTREDFDSLTIKPSHGLGLAHWGGVYPDLFVAMRTISALENTPIVTIPDDNRRLVEYALHSELVQKTADEFIDDEKWRKHYENVRGREFAAAREGRRGGLSHKSSFENIKFAGDEFIAARLGSMDRVFALGDIFGPFGVYIGDLKVPNFLAHDIGENPEIQIFNQLKDRLLIRIDKTEFLYDALGLRRETKDREKDR